MGIWGTAQAVGKDLRNVTEAISHASSKGQSLEDL